MTIVELKQRRTELERYFDDAMARMEAIKLIEIESVKRGWSIPADIAEDFKKEYEKLERLCKGYKEALKRVQVMINVMRGNG